MSKYDKAGLAMIPSGYKASKVYSLIPNSSDGDFDFSRASTATRVNKDGLIETVATNVPRLEYPFIDGVVQDTPSLLLEPSRTNNQVYSEEFDNAAWSKVNVTISANDAISPDGSQNADKISETSDTGLHVIADSQSFVSGTSYVFSCFAKKGTSKDFRIAAGNPATIPISSIFDLEDGTVTSSLGSSTSTIEYFGNGWYRCAVVATASATASTSLTLGLADGTTTSYTGNTSNNLYAWGAQVEQGSYATSYIPTSGSSVTRAAETSNGAGNSTVFNDSEGVLYAEFSVFDATGDGSFIGICDGTDDNRILIGKTGSDATIKAVINRTGQSTKIFTTTEDFSDNVKVKLAFRYKSEDYSVFLNGENIVTNNYTYVPTGLSQVNFDNGGGSSKFYGRLSNIKVYNTALSDSELQALTT